MRMVRCAWGLLCCLILLPSLCRPALALPSFARQTGLVCASCHVSFPELTETGRLFKLNGYVQKGGESDLPSLSVMTQLGFTHTQAGQPGGAAPDFAANDNFALEQASLFYGGAILSNWGLGAFAQTTYSGADRRFGWDNVDVRMAQSAVLASAPLVFGATLNNNPSVQDVFNTTPAWRFPFASPSLAPRPAAATLIEGGLSQQVAGLGGYALWNNLVYAETTIYRSLSKRSLTTLGTDVSGFSPIDGAAPYWRVALQPKLDAKTSLEIGLFGIEASVFPQQIRGAGTDHFSDVGLDTQFQFVGERDQISFQASWINENQSHGASFALGNSARAHDALRSFNAKTSYFYDHTYGLNLAWFDTTGTTDSALYTANAIGGSASGSPDSRGFVIEADYLPFMHGGPSFWPWLNMRLQIQYVMYDRFNGAGRNYDGFGRNASDNNTLFLLAWIQF